MDEGRKKKLLDLFEGIDQREIILPLIDDMLFLEGQLTELKKLPFLRTHPKYPDIQKATPAARQYKELLQQYNNVVKLLTGILRKEAVEDDSPLRQYLREIGQ